MQVKGLQEGKPHYVWLILILLTFFAFVVGKLELGGITVIATILLSTLIKGQMVADYFMGLHRVRWKWKIIMYSSCFIDSPTGC